MTLLRCKFCVAYHRWPLPRNRPGDSRAFRAPVRLAGQSRLASSVLYWECWVAKLMGLPELFFPIHIAHYNVSPIIWSIVGSALFVAHYLADFRAAVPDRRFWTLEAPLLGDVSEHNSTREPAVAFYRLSKMPFQLQTSK
jgi:hypothetical protein